jgi:hypothetical protein
VSVVVAGVLALVLGGLALGAGVRKNVTVSTTDETITVQPGQEVLGTLDLVPGITYHAVVSGTIRLETPGTTPHYELHDAFYCYETDSVDAANNGCVASGTPTSPVYSLNAFQGQGSPDCAAKFACALNLGAKNGLSPQLPYAGSSHTYETDLKVIAPGKLRLTADRFCQTNTTTKCVSGSFSVMISKKESSVCKAPWAAGDRPTADTQARAAAINEVHVVNVCPDAQFHKGGFPANAWYPLEIDTVLKVGDQVTTDPTGTVTLAFADNSTITLSDLTALKIGSFFTEGGVVKVEIDLVQGSVAATVCKSCATKSDFRIKSPTGTISVRGTIFSVFYDSGSGSTLVSTRRGLVAVAPTNKRLRAVTVGVGREVLLTAKTESAVAPIGKAGRRGGDDIVRARNLVMQVVATHNRACVTTTPRTNALSIKSAAGGWLVTVKLEGGLNGPATFLVKGAKVTPVNALAKRLARSCH